MKEIAEDIETHYLFPSTLYVGENRTLITTVLGSCVSVCLYDAINRKGGVNHYMLPLWNGKGLASPKFGNIAIERLIEKVTAYGTFRENLVAKVFGGANQTDSVMQIGSRNIQTALDMLDKHKIKVVAQSVGGTIGRKIIFDTESGVVRMKYIGQ